MQAKDLLREKILSSALKILNRFGYGGLTLSELARQAKITKQRLYYHFPTPQDVIQVLAQEWSETGRTAAIEALARTHEAGAYKVLAISEGMFDWMKEHEELSRLSLVLFQSSPHIKPLQNFMETARKAGRERIRSFLAQDKRLEKMKPRELDELITSLHSHMYGFHFYIVAMNDYENIKVHEENCEKGLRQMLATALKG
jgi:Transcriptional regulator